jgi:peptidoglycan hydrolase-like protein with peptidoglycan-binding domain
MERDEGMGLSKGSEGAEVKAFQEKLILLGHDLGKWGADGKFGNATEAAVKAFQADHALPINGAWGEAEEAMANDLIEIINEYPPEPIEKLVIFKQSDWDDYCRAIEKILTKAT